MYNSLHGISDVKIEYNGDQKYLIQKEGNLWRSQYRLTLRYLYSLSKQNLNGAQYCQVQNQESNDVSCYPVMKPEVNPAERSIYTQNDRKLYKSQSLNGKAEFSTSKSNNGLKSLEKLYIHRDDINLIKSRNE